MNINNLKYCKICGKMFEYKVSLMCPACLIQMDKDFLVCRDYLDKHRNSTIKEMSEKTEVSEKIILTLMKEGRLMIQGNAEFVCQKCGQAIAYGKYCDRCLGEMKSDLSFAKSSIKQSQSYTDEKKYSNNNEKSKTGNQSMFMAEKIKKERDRR